MAAGMYALRSRPQLQDFRFADPRSVAWRGLYAAVSIILLVLSVRAWLSRFGLLLGEHTIFSGVTYTDAHVELPGLLLVAFVLLCGAGVAAYSALRRLEGARWIALAVLPGVLLYMGVQAADAAVDTFIVKPNELVKEQPYIRNNIEATRASYALDGILVRPFAAGTTVADADAAKNQPTLQNVRLWDAQALQDTLRQIQEIRTYYDFPGIDIDRYTLDGQLREVMLATRELSTAKLPESSRNWINERLVYTHGYGITMNPVNGFTAEGLPTLLLSNMPVQSAIPRAARGTSADLFRRDDERRRLREDASAGVRLSAGPVEQPDELYRLRRYRAWRLDSKGRSLHWSAATSPSCPSAMTSPPTRDC